VPTGGTEGQILAKIDATDYNTQWIDNYTSSVRHEVKAGQAITKGQAVYVSSADGTNMIVSKADYSVEATSSKVIGLVAQTMATNDIGFVVTEGLLDGLDTSTATAGAPVWLGDDGNLLFGLANKPVAPNHMVFIGVVTRVQQNNGEIFIKAQNGFELGELHDVLLSSQSDGQVLTYDSTSGLWKNEDIPHATPTSFGVVVGETEYPYYGFDQYMTDQTTSYSYSYVAATRTLTLSLPFTTVFSQPTPVTGLVVGRTVMMFMDMFSVYGVVIEAVTPNSMTFVNDPNQLPPSDVSGTTVDGFFMGQPYGGNTYLGHNSGQTVVNDYRNTVVGVNSLETANVSSPYGSNANNILVGSHILQSAVDCVENVFVGSWQPPYSAPVTRTGLVGNIGIGINAGLSLPDQRIYTLIIGNDGGYDLNDYDTVITSASGTRLIRAYNNGSVTTPNQPYMQARGSGSAWMNAGGTNTLRNGVPGGFSWVVSQNIGNHFNPSTGAFIAPVTGVYQCIFSTYQSTGGAGVFIHWLWGVGGSLTWNSGTTPYNIYGYTGGGYADGVNVVHNIYVTAGNGITINGTMVNGATFYSDYTYLSIRLLG
jgi:hypothetical protein